MIIIIIIVVEFFINFSCLYIFFFFFNIYLMFMIIIIKLSFSYLKLQFSKIQHSHSLTSFYFPKSSDFLISLLEGQFFYIYPCLLNLLYFLALLQCLFKCALYDFQVLVLAHIKDLVLSLQQQNYYRLFFISTSTPSLSSSSKSSIYCYYLAYTFFSFYALSNYFG